MNPPDKQQVLSKAVVRAAMYLGLQERTLADVLGLDMVTTSGLYSGDYLLSQGEREWELAVLLVNLYDRLGVITGGSQADAVKWLNSPNYALQNCSPIELITTTDGLVYVVRYLSSMTVNYDLKDMASRITPETSMISAKRISVTLLAGKSCETKSCQTAC